MPPSLPIGIRLSLSIAIEGISVFLVRELVDQNSPWPEIQAGSEKERV